MTLQPQPLQPLIEQARMMAATGPAAGTPAPVLSSDKPPAEPPQPGPTAPPAGSGPTSPAQSLPSRKRGKKEAGEEPKIVRIRRYLSKRYDFQLDMVANEIEWRPKSATNQPPDRFVPLNENTLMIELYEQGFTGFADQVLALMRSDFVPTINPVQAYFEGLPAWDESKPDYIAQLAGFVKARDQTWFATQYKKWLVRAVACGISEIPFNKQCLVLVGKQNDGKSSFIRFHVPPALEAYYTEHIDFSGGTDGKIALCENFLINLDELAGFSKMDINKCKAFLTEDKVKVRRPFARKPALDKRRASFFGSTNQSNFLTDETGNVRWLVMETYEILHDNGGAKGYARNVDIDQVWAQAYALLKEGFAYQMSREDIDQSEKHNRQHMYITPEREMVMKHFLPAEPKEQDAQFMMPGEVTRWLEMHYEHKIRINANNIGKALTALGFTIRSGRRSDCVHPIQAYWLKTYE